MTTPRPPASRPRRAAALLVVSTALAVLAGPACSSERPTLQAAADPPPSTATTLVTTVTEAAPVEPVDLAPPSAENLLGFIATPISDPTVFAGPALDAEPIEIGSETAIGAPTTFAVLGDPTAQPGTEWIQVALPTRPNGATGWVPASSVQVTKTPYRLFVDLDARTLRAEHTGDVVLETEVAVGTETNPTPTGATYVTELIESVNPGGAYGPYAFGLALHSDTLTEFAGGPGQVGIHGTNRPDLIGTRVSSGCIRLANDDIRRLVDLQLPLGVPVIIT